MKTLCTGIFFFFFSVLAMGQDPDGDDEINSTPKPPIVCVNDNITLESKISQPREWKIKLKSSPNSIWQLLSPPVGKDIVIKMIPAYDSAYVGMFDINGEIIDSILIQLLRVKISGNTSLCSGGETKLTAISNSNSPDIEYKWSTAATFKLIQVSQPGIYTVTVTLSNGCSAVDKVTVMQGSIDAKINQEKNYTATICDSTILTASGGTKYHWSTGESTATIKVPVVDSIYYVTVSNAEGCIDSAKAEIKTTDPPRIINAKTICKKTTRDYYTFYFESNADQITSEIGTWKADTLSNGSFAYTIDSIPAGMDTNVTAMFIQSQDCKLKVPIKAPNPAPPTLTNDQLIGCANTLPYPAFEGKADSSLYKIWWFNLTNGAILASDTSKYSPPQSGPIRFYIRSYNPSNECFSAGRDTGFLELKENPNVTVTGDAKFCAGDSITLTSSATGKTPFLYLWSNNKDSKAISVGTAGTYTVTVTDGNGCEGSATKSVESVPIPGVRIDSIVCQPGLQFYDVYFTPDVSNIIVTAQPSHSIENINGIRYRVKNVPNDSAVTVTVGLNVAPGCDTSFTVDYTCKCDAIAPQIDIKSHTVCEGDPIPAFIGNINAKYEIHWYSSSDLTLLSKENNFTPSKGGDYNAFGYDPVKKCYSTESVKVTLTINPKPNANIFNNNQTACKGVQVVFPANPAGNQYSYKWNNNQSTATLTLQTGSLAAQSHTYTVTVTNNNTGCSATATATVQVKPVPENVVIDPTNNKPCMGQTDIPYSVSYTINPPPSNPTISYAWTLTPTNAGAIDLPSDNQNITVDWKQQSTATLKARVTVNGCTDSASLAIALSGDAIENFSVTDNVAFLACEVDGDPADVCYQWGYYTLNSTGQIVSTTPLTGETDQILWLPPGDIPNTRRYWVEISAKQPDGICSNCKNRKSFTTGTGAPAANALHCTIAPNPNNGRFSLSWVHNAGGGDLSYAIYHLNGHLIKTWTPLGLPGQNTGTTDVDLQYLPVGPYILQVRDNRHGTQTYLFTIN